MSKSTIRIRAPHATYEEYVAWFRITHPTAPGQMLNQKAWEVRVLARRRVAA